MKIENYGLMKTTFEYCRSDLFNYFNGGEKNYIIYFDKQSNMILSGWVFSSSNTVNDYICIVLNNNEIENFDEKIYNEKINLLTKKVKEYYVNKKLQDIDGDFV